MQEIPLASNYWDHHRQLQYSSKDHICKNTCGTGIEEQPPQWSMWFTIEPYLYRPSPTKNDDFWIWPLHEGNDRSILVGSNHIFWSYVPSGVTNIIAQAHGMDPVPCLYHTKTINTSQCHIHTALGVSRGSYKNSPPYRILGLVQGNGGVASFWALMSSINFFARDNIYKGLDFPGITAANGIKKNNGRYVNNVDTCAW